MTIALVPSADRDEFILASIKLAFCELFPGERLLVSRYSDPFVETWAKLIRNDVNDEYTVAELTESLVNDGGFSEDDANLLARRLACDGLIEE